MNLGPFEGFALVKTDTSLEASRLSAYCLCHDIPVIRIGSDKICPDTHVPCGSVEWCSRSFARPVVPDYYPEWANGHLHRKVYRSDTWILGKQLFVKPADRYKRFTGFVTSGYYRKKKRGLLIWSEVVSFTNEWRYYVSSGKVLCGEWYWGDEVNTPDAPDLEIDIPPDYSGALDFGTLDDGSLALVESQHPFACGWYGPQSRDHLYLQWLIDGWTYMISQYG